MKTKLQIDASEYNFSLDENPKIGTRFKPETPFDRFTRGIVWHDRPTDRRYVRLHTPAVENDGFRLPSFKTLVSRYLFSVKYFKETGLLIPEGYEVDHRDNNRWNDTYDNFQLLTSEDNLKKSGSLPGRLFFVMICPVCLGQWSVERECTALHHKEYEHHVYCCSLKCKITFRSTLIPYKHFLPLRIWIAQRQIYKTVKKWAYNNIEEDVQIICTEMLNFNLEEMCGRRVAYDTPQLLSELKQHMLASDLRREGKTWQDIADVFCMSYYATYSRFVSVPLTDNDCVWESYRLQHNLNEEVLPNESI